MRVGIMYEALAGYSDPFITLCIPCVPTGIADESSSMPEPRVFVHTDDTSLMLCVPVAHFLIGAPH